MAGRGSALERGLEGCAKVLLVGERTPLLILMSKVARV